METSSPTTFRHRHNRDGTWDSICLKCYLTAETAMQEEDLVGAERSHNCAELLAIKADGRSLQRVWCDAGDTMVRDLYYRTTCSLSTAPMEISNTFMHRHNRHGSWDSVCLRCFQTIARSAREPDLQQNGEDSHVCNPSIVEYYRDLSKSVLDFRKKAITKG